MRRRRRPLPKEEPARSIELRARGKMQQRRYKSTSKGFAKRLRHNAVVNSRSRGLQPPTLTQEWIQEQIEQGCRITGLPFVLDGPPRHPQAPSLDRIDNSRPYTQDNTRVVCWAVNLGLGTWGLSEYLRIAGAATKRQATN